MTKILIPIKEQMGMDSKVANTLGNVDYIMIDKDGSYYHIDGSQKDELESPIKFVLNLQPNVILAPEACGTAIKLTKSKGITMYSVNEDDKVTEIYQKYKAGVLTQL